MNYNDPTSYYLITAYSSSGVLTQSVELSKYLADDAAHFLLTNKRVKHVDIRRLINTYDVDRFSRVNGLIAYDNISTERESDDQITSSLRT